tara:strand:+ start:18161 stop:30973 length:12813 start_codon:yes stop_codon:yes gene_type:complete
MAENTYCQCNADIDCAGICGGSSVVDECGQCYMPAGGYCVDVTEVPAGTCCDGPYSDCVSSEGFLDCAGVCNGSSVYDLCGICDDDASNNTVLECNSKCPTAQLAECSEYYIALSLDPTVYCNSETYFTDTCGECVTTQTNVDCADCCSTNVVSGDVETGCTYIGDQGDNGYDVCGNCGGDCTGTAGSVECTGDVINNGEPDCNGYCGTQHNTDSCGVCYDTYGDAPTCVQDCEGTWLNDTDCSSGYPFVCSDDNTIPCKGYTDTTSCIGNGTCGVNQLDICVTFKYFNECGDCALDGYHPPCEQDCAGTWGGDAVVDNCGTCDSDSSNDCIQDCTGTWGGTHGIDDCGMCTANGGSSPLLDCNGDCVYDGQVCGGTATIVDPTDATSVACDIDFVPKAEDSDDACGDCYGGLTGVEKDAALDCSGTCDGTSDVDPNCPTLNPCICGNDGDGNPISDGEGGCEINPCIQDCSNTYSGDSYYDTHCNIGGTPDICVCGYDFETDDDIADGTNDCVAEACIEDCSGTWGGTSEEDLCGNCVCGLDFAGDQITENENCDDPVSDSTPALNRPCTKDCAGVDGGSAHADDNCDGIQCVHLPTYNEDEDGVSEGCCVNGTSGNTDCQVDCAGFYWPSGSEYASLADGCGDCFVGGGNLDDPTYSCNESSGGCVCSDDSVIITYETGCTIDGGELGDTCYCSGATCSGYDCVTDQCPSDCAGAPGGTAFWDRADCQPSEDCNVSDCTDGACLTCEWDGEGDGDCADNGCSCVTTETRCELVCAGASTCDNSGFGDVDISACEGYYGPSDVDAGDYVDFCHKCHSTAYDLDEGTYFCIETSIENVTFDGNTGTFDLYIINRGPLGDFVVSFNRSNDDGFSEAWEITGIVDGEGLVYTSDKYENFVFDEGDVGADIIDSEDPLMPSTEADDYQSTSRHFMTIEFQSLAGDFENDGWDDVLIEVNEDEEATQFNDPIGGGLYSIFEGEWFTYFGCMDPYSTSCLQSGQYGGGFQVGGSDNGFCDCASIGFNDNRCFSNHNQQDCTGYPTIEITGLTLDSSYEDDALPSYFDLLDDETYLSYDSFTLQFTFENVPDWVDSNGDNFKLEVFNSDGGSVSTHNLNAGAQTTHIFNDEQWVQNGLTSGTYTAVLSWPIDFADYNGIIIPEEVSSIFSDSIIRSSTEIEFTIELHGNGCMDSSSTGCDTSLFTNYNQYAQYDCSGDFEGGDISCCQYPDTHTQYVCESGENSCSSLASPSDECGVGEGINCIEGSLCCFGNDTGNGDVNSMDGCGFCPGGTYFSAGEGSLVTWYTNHGDAGDNFACFDGNIEQCEYLGEPAAPGGEIWIADASDLEYGIACECGCTTPNDIECLIAKDDCVASGSEVGYCVPACNTDSECDSHTGYNSGQSTCITSEETWKSLVGDEQGTNDWINLGIQSPEKTGLCTTRDICGMCSFDSSSVSGIYYVLDDGTDDFELVTGLSNTDCHGTCVGSEGFGAYLHDSCGYCYGGNTGRDIINELDDCGVCRLGPECNGELAECGDGETGWNGIDYNCCDPDWNISCLSCDGVTVISDGSWSDEHLYDSCGICNGGHIGTCIGGTYDEDNCIQVSNYPSQTNYGGYITQILCEENGGQCFVTGGTLADCLGDCNGPNELDDIADVEGIGEDNLGCCHPINDIVEYFADLDETSVSIDHHYCVESLTLSEQVECECDSLDENNECEDASGCTDFTDTTCRRILSGETGICLDGGNNIVIEYSTSDTCNLSGNTWTSSETLDLCYQRGDGVEWSGTIQPGFNVTGCTVDEDCNLGSVEHICDIDGTFGTAGQCIFTYHSHNDDCYGWIDPQCSTCLNITQGDLIGTFTDCAGDCYGVNLNDECNCNYSIEENPGECMDPECRYQTYECEDPLEGEENQGYCDVIDINAGYPCIVGDSGCGDMNNCIAGYPNPECDIGSGPVCSNCILSETQKYSFNINAGFGGGYYVLNYNGAQYSGCGLPNHLQIASYNVCPTQWTLPSNNSWNSTCIGCNDVYAYNIEGQMLYDDCSCYYHPPVLSISEHEETDVDGNPIHGLIYCSSENVCETIKPVQLSWSYNGHDFEYFEDTTFRVKRLNSEPGNDDINDSNVTESAITYSSDGCLEVVPAGQFVGYYQSTGYLVKDCLTGESLDSSNEPGERCQIAFPELCPNINSCISESISSDDHLDYGCSQHWAVLWSCTTDYETEVETVCALTQEDDFSWPSYPDVSESIRLSYVTELESATCDSELIDSIQQNESNRIGYVCSGSICDGNPCSCNPDWGSELLDDMSWMVGYESTPECGSCEFNPEYAANIVTLTPAVSLINPCICDDPPECGMCSFANNESIVTELDYYSLPYYIAESYKQLSINVLTYQIDEGCQYEYEEGYEISSRLLTLPEWTNGTDGTNDVYSGINFYCPELCPYNVTEVVDDFNWCELRSDSSGHQHIQFDDLEDCNSVCSTDCVDWHNYIVDIGDGSESIWNDIICSGVYEIKVEYPFGEEPSQYLYEDNHYVRINVTQGCMDINACTCGALSTLYPEHSDWVNQDCSNVCIDSDGLTYCGTGNEYICFLPESDGGFGFYNPNAQVDYCTDLTGSSPYEEDEQLCSSISDAVCDYPNGYCNQSCTYPIPGCMDSGFNSGGYENNQFGNGSVIPGNPAANYYVCSGSIGSFDPEDTIHYGWNPTPTVCSVLNEDTGVFEIDQTVCDDAGEGVCGSYSTYDNGDCTYWGCTIPSATNYMSEIEWITSQEWNIGLNEDADEGYIEEWAGSDGQVYGVPDYWSDIAYGLPGSCILDFNYKLKWEIFEDGQSIPMDEGVLDLEDSEFTIGHQKPKRTIIPSGAPQYEYSGGPVRRYIEFSIYSGDDSVFVDYGDNVPEDATEWPFTDAHSLIWGSTPNLTYSNVTDLSDITYECEYDASSCECTPIGIPGCLDEDCVNDEENTNCIMSDDVTQTDFDTQGTNHDPYGYYTEFVEGYCEVSNLECHPDVGMDDDTIDTWPYRCCNNDTNCTDEKCVPHKVRFNVPTYDYSSLDDDVITYSIGLTDPTSTFTKTKSLVVTYYRNNYGPLLMVDRNKNLETLGYSENPTLDIADESTPNYYFIAEDLDGDAYTIDFSVEPMGDATEEGLSVTTLVTDETAEWNPPAVIPYLTLNALEKGQYKVSVTLEQIQSNLIVDQMVCSETPWVNCTLNSISNGDEFCNSIFGGSTCTVVETNLYDYTYLSPNNDPPFNGIEFVVTVVDSSGPDGYIVPSLVSSYGISPDTYIFQTFGNDQRSILDLSSEAHPETTDSYVITAGFGQSIGQGNCDDPIAARECFEYGPEDQCEHEGTNYSCIYTDYVCETISDSIDTIEQGFSFGQSDVIFNTLSSDTIINENGFYDISFTAPWPSDYTCFTMSPEDIYYVETEESPAVEASDLMYINPNAGGWETKNYTINPIDTVWKYEMEIRKESSLDANDFDDSDSNVIYSSSFQDWSDFSELSEYVPPTFANGDNNSDNSFNNVGPFLSNGQYWQFSEKGNYQIRCKAYDVFYNPAEGGTNAGETTMNIEVPYVIPLEQSITGSYAPWRGRNVPSYLTSSMNNNRNDIEGYDLDERVSLGCFYYEGDNNHGLNWDTINSASYSDGFELHYEPTDNPETQIAENKFIPDVDIRTPISFYGKYGTPFKYYDKDISKEEYYETSAPSEVQFYFYPRRYPKYEDSRSVVRITFWNPTSAYQNGWRLEDNEFSDLGWANVGFYTGMTEVDVNVIDNGGEGISPGWKFTAYDQGRNGLPVGAYFLVEVKALGEDDDSYRLVYSLTDADGIWSEVDGEQESYIHGLTVGSYKVGGDLLFSAKERKSFTYDLADIEAEGLSPGDWSDTDELSNTYVGFIDWGDGSPIEYDSEPFKLGYDAVLSHTYERSGFYDVTGYMFRVKYGESDDILGVYNTFQKFTVKFLLNDNPDYEGEFKKFGGGKFTYIPYNESVPMIGGISKYSMYAKTIKRNLGYIDDSSVPLEVDFYNYKDRLDAEYALALIDSDIFGSEISKYTGSYGNQLTTTTGTGYPDPDTGGDLYVYTSSVEPSEIISPTEITSSMNQGFFSGSVDVSGSIDVTKPLYMIHKGLYHSYGEFGNHLGETNISQVRYFNDVVPMWEMLGFEDNVTNNPDNERYWGNIAPQNLSIFDDRQSDGTWTAGYYYPVIPLVDDFGNFTDTINGIPFGTPGRDWNELDEDAPITNENYEHPDMIVNLTMNEITADDAVEDESGFESAGMVIGDYRVNFSNNERPNKGDVVVTPITNKEDKAF